MKNTILTYNDVKKVKPGKSDEKLVSVRSFDDSIVARYEKFDMLAYTGPEILVRETVARRLAAANKQLKSKYTLGLKIVYGYRALAVQTAYFENKQSELSTIYPDLPPGELAALTHNFVAVPEIAGHVTGGAPSLIQLARRVSGMRDTKALRGYSLDGRNLFGLYLQEDRNHLFNFFKMRIRYSLSFSLFISPLSLK